MDMKFILTVLITMVLLANLVFAIPGVPHAFYGSVTWNGQPAPDGITITAKINGVEVASTTTKDGKYGYDPVFYVDDPNNDRVGSTINFFVNGVDSGQTATFCNACFNHCGTDSSDCAPLDLTATGPTEPTGPTGPTGAITGGAIISPPAETEEEEEEEEIVTEEVTEECQESWSCSDWGECVEGIQTRVCTDENNCGTEEDKPLESQPCTITEVETPTVAGEAVPSGMAGMLVLLSNPVYATILALLVIAVLLTIFRARILKMRKKKKK